MDKFIYSAFSHNIIGKKNKEIGEILERERSKYNYAYINRNRLILTNEEGINLTEALIVSINQNSFIYLQGLEKNFFYFLVYLNDVIIWASKIAEEELHGMLELYVKKNSEVDINIYNCQKDFENFIAPSTENRIITLTSNPLDKIDLNSYLVEPIDKIREKILQSEQISFKKTIIVILILLIIGGWLWYLHEKKERLARLEKKTVTVDLWKEYRQTLIAPKPYVEVTQVFSDLERIIQTFPDMKLDNFIYGQKNLKLVLIPSIDAKIDIIKEWASNNNYQFHLLQDRYFLIKNFNLPKENLQYKIIMDSNEIRLKLFNLFYHFSKNIKLTFAPEKRNKNYSEINCQINFTQVPTTIVNSLLLIIRFYPIVLIDMKGKFFDGNFTGILTLKIVGD